MVVTHLTVRTQRLHAVLEIETVLLAQLVAGHIEPRPHRVTGPVGSDLKRMQVSSVRVNRKLLTTKVSLGAVARPFTGNGTCASTELLASSLHCEPSWAGSNLRRSCLCGGDALLQEHLSTVFGSVVVLGMSYWAEFHMPDCSLLRRTRPSKQSLSNQQGHKRERNYRSLLPQLERLLYLVITRWHLPHPF